MGLFGTQVTGRITRIDQALPRPAINTPIPGAVPVTLIEVLEDGGKTRKGFLVGQRTDLSVGQNVTMALAKTWNAQWVSWAVGGHYFGSGPATALGVPLYLFIKNIIKI